MVPFRDNKLRRAFATWFGHIYPLCDDRGGYRFLVHSLGIELDQRLYRTKDEVECGIPRALFCHTEKGTVVYACP
jgi:hypothetical protein